MARFPKAVWRGPIPNDTANGMVRPLLGLILHVEQGSEAGTNSWFHNAGAQASAHFGNPKSGPLDEWLDTKDKAWAEVAGNSRWISLEFEGFADKDHPTDSQLENAAQLFAWLHATEGVPLQITNSVSIGGLGWHGMGGAAWGGHYGCPGSLIKAARPTILTRAQHLVMPAPPKPGPTGTVPHWFHRNLYVATPHYLSGPDVITVQGKVGATKDGVYGPGTKSKVITWQEHHALRGDGIVGPQTAIKLGP